MAQQVNLVVGFRVTALVYLAAAFIFVGSVFSQIGDRLLKKSVRLRDKC